MKSRTKHICTTLMFWLTAMGMPGQHTLRAQTSASQNHVERKLVYKVDPFYPADLRRLFIGGVVRLKIVVSARGTVDSVTPMGGNPAFVDSSVVAVKKWKYTPAESPTEMMINIDFDPRR
jgi:TonB family protein